MQKGTFYLLEDPDLIELFFQQYGSKLVFRGGARVMQEQAENSLESINVLLKGYPMSPAPHELELHLHFVDDGGSVAGRVVARLLNATPQEVADFLEDTFTALESTRSTQAD